MIEPTFAADGPLDGDDIDKIRAELHRLVSMRCQGYLTAAEEARYAVLCAVEHRALARTHSPVA